jgi:biopolymer transport protein ExbB
VHFILNTILLLAALAFAQVDLVRQQAEINNAKANLEEARQERDMAVAKRWQEKAKQNEERERIELQLENRKEKTEAILSERSRLFEELRIAREALNFANEDAEKARAAFAGVFPGQDRAHELKSISNGALPFAFPEISISDFRDSPLQAAEILFSLAKKDISYAAEIEMSDSLLRLGGVGALRVEAQNSFSMLLPQEGERGKVFSWQSNLQPEIQSAIEGVFNSSDSSKFLLVPIDPLLSTVLSKEMAHRTEKKLSENFQQFMQDGGILMYPIFSMLIIALALIAERLFVLFRNGSVSNKKIEQILTLHGKGEFKGSLGKIASIIFNPEIKTREEAEKAVEAEFAKIVPNLENRLPIISVLGTTAPLMGLLGTVMGMIELFNVITLHGAADPKLLAGGISIALVTTEAGLSVAIPVHLLHTWLAGRVEKIIGRLDYAAMKLLSARDF